jgi:hypothetical protein
MAGDLDAQLPHLVDDGMRRTSPATRLYNCIAWAADDDRRWWWPAADGYWPLGAPRVVSLAAFVSAYGTLGYVPCADSSWELGYEKVAIYCASGEPTHAAKQLDTGLWTSKLGPYWDVEHCTPGGVEGPLYGRVAQLLRRPIRDAARLGARFHFASLLASSS